MAFVKQTLFGAEGNCLQSSVAGLLGLELDEVPHFVMKAAWFSLFEDWLNQRGLTIVAFDYVCDMSDVECDYLALGPSPRGRNHCVIMNACKMVWDPHPDNTGLREVQRVYLITPVNLSRWRKTDG